MTQGFSTILSFGGIRYAPPDVQKITPETIPGLTGPLRLWDAAQGICAYQRGPEIFARAQCLAYRAAIRQTPKELADNWRWHLHLWDDAERRRFTDTMARAWTACQDRFVHTRSGKFCPHSPNTVPYSLAELKEMEKNGVDWRKFLPVKATIEESKRLKGEK